MTEPRLKWNFSDHPQTVLSLGYFTHISKFISRGSLSRYHISILNHKTQKILWLAKKLLPKKTNRQTNSQYHKNTGFCLKYYLNISSRRRNSQKNKEQKASKKNRLYWNFSLTHWLMKKVKSMHENWETVYPLYSLRL